MIDQRLRRYTRAYFTERDIPEVQAYTDHRIRNDQLACFHWALHEPTGGMRLPHMVLDVGAGRGELSAMFALCGIPVTGVEPSAAGAKLYRETLRRWAKAEARLISRLEECRDHPDTVIFCRKQRNYEGNAEGEPSIALWWHRDSGQFLGHPNDQPMFFPNWPHRETAY